MDTSEKWEIVREYQRRARRFLVEPLKCEYCEEEVVIRLGEDDGPVFRCYYCGMITTPGIIYLDSLKEKLNG